MTYKLSDRVSPLLVVAVQAGPIHPSLQWSFKGRRRSDHSARTVNIIFPGTCPHWWARSSLEMIIIWLFNKVNWGRWKELSTAGYLQRHQQRFSCSLSIPSSKNEALSSWNVECAVMSFRRGRTKRTTEIDEQERFPVLVCYLLLWIHKHPPGAITIIVGCCFRRPKFVQLTKERPLLSG